MIEFKEHIEIFRETYGTRFEAWRVLIDPKENYIQFFGNGMKGRLRIGNSLFNR